MNNLRFFWGIAGMVLILMSTAGCGSAAQQPSSEEISSLPVASTEIPLPITGDQAAAPQDSSNTLNRCAAAIQPNARQVYSFEDITPCLNTPTKLVEFMRNNLQWNSGWDNVNYGDNTYSPAKEVYAFGVDDCDGLAEFAACVLSKHGYEAYNVGISILGPQGHNVAGYVGDDGMMYAIHNGQEISGPFTSWEELAQSFIDQGVAAPPDGVLWLFDPCIPNRVTGEPVIELPHQVIR